MRTFIRRALACLSVVAVVFVPACFAQTDTLNLSSGVDSLSLSSGVAASDGTVSLNLTLNSPAGSEPAALQWTVTYPSANVTAIAATAAAGATSANKSLSCNGGSGTLTCVLYGMNADPIANGVAATLKLNMAAGVSSTAIGLANAIGASAAGDAISVTTIGGTVTGGSNLTSPAISRLSCSPTSLGPSAQSTCTVALANAAPTGGATVSLTNSNATLTAPSSVLVPATATTATFNITTAAIPSDQSATLKATYNGSSSQTVVTLVAPIAVSTLACNPSSLGANASTTCTVTLTKPAPAGGASVTLTNSNNTLSVPGSVTVPATATTATFSATTTSIPSPTSSTVTATYNSTSAKTTITLGGSIIVSGLSCAQTTLAPLSSVMCIIQLNKNAPLGGVNVAVSTVNSILNAPPLVLVGWNSDVATFTLQAGSFTSNQSGSVTATYSGTSQTVAITLTLPPVSVSALACNPSSLGPNASSTCTVTLSKPAPTGGASVTLTNTNTALTAPASVSVPATATTATFAVSTAALSTDQKATLKATYSGTSAQATLDLIAPVAVSSLSCNPSSLGPNASSTCTVTLSKAAPSGGASVTISNSNAKLSTPASVSVAASQTTATFSATTLSLSADSTANLTAAYNNSSASATVNLVAPLAISSLACTPSTLTPSASATCSVTLNKNAPAAGTSVTIKVVNTVLSAPASITMQNIAQTNFTLKAGSFTSNQTGSVTASVNGSSQTANISLSTAAPANLTVKLLSCSPSGLMSAGAANCTVTLSQEVTTYTWVNLTSSSQLSVPSRVGVGAGAPSANFTATAGTITADATGSITATLGASSLTANIPLWSTPTLNSLACTGGSVSTGWTANCTVTMSKAAGDIAINLSTTAGAVPATVTVPKGATTATFKVNVTGTLPASVSITAKYNGVSKSATLSVATSSNSLDTSAVVKAIDCLPKALTAGTHATCRIAIDGTQELPVSGLRIATSSAALRAPERVALRRGQRIVEFQVDAVDADEPVQVSASLGSDVVTDVISVRRDRSEPIHVPDTQFVKYGSEVRFAVSASDRTATLTTEELPLGAEFDSQTNEFRWKPVSTQIGAHRITFAAMNPMGEKATASVTVHVESGSPVVTGIVNAATRSAENACSSGAVASIQGRWLNGGKVWAGDMQSPVLPESDTELNILCPELVAGTEFRVSVETAAGISPSIRTIASPAAPGIFTVDGSGAGQALAIVEGTNRVAMRPNYRTAAQPATEGDRVVIYATGIDSLARLTARIAGQELTPLAVLPAPNRPGVFQVIVTVPGSATLHGEVPISLAGRRSDGVEVTSNRATIMLESGSSQ